MKRRSIVLKAIILTKKHYFILEYSEYWLYNNENAYFCEHLSLITWERNC